MAGQSVHIINKCPEKIFLLRFLCILSCTQHTRTHKHTLSVTENESFDHIHWNESGCHVLIHCAAFLSLYVILQIETERNECVCVLHCAWIKRSNFYVAKGSNDERSTHCCTGYVSNFLSLLSTSLTQNTHFMLTII